MNRRFAVASLAVALGVAALIPASAGSGGAAAGAATTRANRPAAVVKSATGSYIVVMREDPLLGIVSQSRLETPSALRVGRLMTRSHDDVLAGAGVSSSAKVNDYTNALNGFSAVLDESEAAAVAADPAVAAVLPDEIRQAESLSATGTLGDREWGDKPDDLGNFLGLSDRGEAWRSGINGEGVVIGVIDTGIWPEHPSFADNGSYPDHEPLSDDRPNCEFGNTAANPDDAPFECNNKLIGARQMLDTYRLYEGAEPDEFDSARDDDGHGTHTASTAGGNANVRSSILGRRYGKISGIAPHAQIIAYKALGNLGGYTSDLAAAIDQAVADGVDVINYSVGGGADLAGGDAIAFLFAADAGVFVSVSAGNDGPGTETIGGPADVPWVTAVGANTQAQFLEGEVRLGNGRRFRGASVSPNLPARRLVDAEFAGTSEYCDDFLDPALVTGKIVLCRRGGGNGRVAKGFNVFEAGGVGMILYNESDVDTLFSDTHFVPSVHVDLSQGLAIKSYIAAAGDPRAAIFAGWKSTWEPAPSMAYFSSRGPNPTAADIIKPDITAPGVQIMAGNTPFPGPGEAPAGELFQAIAGTSMSSPVVAGTYALLKQAHPGWSPAMAKSALMTTARIDVRDNDRVSRANPFAMGGGMVDPGEVRKAGSAFRPGLVYDAGYFEYLGFLCDAQPDVFGGDADAVCADLESIGVPTDASDLNLASIAVSDLAGTRTVTRTVTNVSSRAAKYTVRVRNPRGYSVKVVPSHFKIQPGESRSFTVEITNTGAPVGEWRFGSLSWVSHGYHVRSPIAVQGVSLAAPAELAGIGTDGAASFDVQFGYTGAYEATAHGLVAPAALAGDISQDPDQTYPSDDDAAGGVDTYAIDVQDVLIARWELSMPDIDDDVDLYLLDSGGNIVAASFNGGTNEFIELVEPADDTYTLVVHGWAVPNEPLAYSVSNWLVPATPGGGSLVIDSAPGAATLGATEAIDVSWSGLTAGTHYVGAVVHRDAAGIAGMTVIGVDA